MDADVCDKDHNPTIVTQLLQLETESRSVLYRTIYGAFPYASGSLLTPRRKTLLLSERAARLAAESEAKFRALLIERLKYTIAKLWHQRFGQSAERGAILEQLELELSDLEEEASANLPPQHRMRRTASPWRAPTVRRALR